MVTSSIFKFRAAIISLELVKLGTYRTLDLVRWLLLRSKNNRACITDYPWIGCFRATWPV